jgi:hypothetical protein
MGQGVADICDANCDAIAKRIATPHASASDCTEPHKKKQPAATIAPPAIAGIFAARLRADPRSPVRELESTHAVSARVCPRSLPPPRFSHGSGSGLMSALRRFAAIAWSAPNYCLRLRSLHSLVVKVYIPFQSWVSLSFMMNHNVTSLPDQSCTSR